MRTSVPALVVLALVVLLAVLVPLAAAPTDLSGQSVEVANDSVTIRLVDADLRGAIRVIGRYLPKPVITGGLGDERVEVFETPGPIPRSELPELLRALAEANGLEVTEDSSSYRITRPATDARPRRALPVSGQEPADSVVLELFTIHLRHARAVDVARTLNRLYGTGRDVVGAGDSGFRTLSERLRADRRAEPPDAPAPSDEPERSGAALQGDVVIVPDERTNSLLIRASDDDFEVLEQAVQELDARPLQVLIEAVVVEVRKDRSFALGFDVDVPPQQVDDATVEGSLAGAGLADLVVEVMGLGRAEVNAVLTAARERGDAEILSRPVLLASNNTEAELLVGSQQPFVQVSRSLPTDTPQRDQVVQYRDVGTRLSIRPTVNQDGYVLLLIQQEISAATGETQFDAPVISSRETTTQVFARDGQTIVIGGLRDETRDEVKTGIPLLVDIPWLGSLFGSTRTNRVETELFLFITPTIIATDEDADRATLERVPEELREAASLDSTTSETDENCDPETEDCAP